MPYWPGSVELDPGLFWDTLRRALMARLFALRPRTDFTPRAGAVRIFEASAMERTYRVWAGSAEPAST
jgi:hypothetical protein